MFQAFRNGVPLTKAYKTKELVLNSLMKKGFASVINGEWFIENTVSVNKL